MTKRDIDKCIKRGSCWSSKGYTPEICYTTKWSYDRPEMRGPNYHATKRDAQLAIDTRRVERQEAKRDPECPPCYGKYKGYET